MSDRIEIEDLGGLAELPPDDPRRRTLQAQPSVRARLRAYQEFMSPVDAPAEKLRDAEDRLAGVLEREIGVPIEAGAGRPQARERAARGGIARWLFAPRMRPVFAAAAILIVAGGTFLAISMGRRDERQLRGTTVPAPGAWNARPTVKTLSPGKVRLSWDPAPGAQTYTLVFLSGDLREVAQVTGQTRSDLLLSRDSLPLGLASGQSLLWRVVAYRGADEVGRSSAGPIEIP
jgi:hypothetical protein